MKSIHLIIPMFAAASLAAALSVGQAQDGPAKQEPKGARQGKALAQLRATPEQLAKIKALRAKFGPKAGLLSAAVRKSEAQLEAKLAADALDRTEVLAAGATLQAARSALAEHKLNAYLELRGIVSRELAAKIHPRGKTRTAAMTKGKGKAQGMGCDEQGEAKGMGCGEQGEAKGMGCGKGKAMGKGMGMGMGRGKGKGMGKGMGMGCGGDQGCGGDNRPKATFGG